MRPARHRVVVTRSTGVGSDLAVQLEAAGFDVAWVPLIEVVPRVSDQTIADALRAVGDGWVVVTSAVAAQLVVDAKPTGPLRFAAVGDATARVIREAVPGAHVVVAEGRAEAGALAATLRHRVRGRAVLVLAAEAGRRTLAAALGEAGGKVTELVAYRTRLPAGAGEAFTAALSPLPAALVLASGSAARNAAAIVDPATRPVPLVLCIGPETARVAAQAGWANVLVAPQASDEAVVAALAERLLGA